MGDETTTIKIEDQPQPKGWICSRCGASVNPANATCPVCSAAGQPYVPIPVTPYCPLWPVWPGWPWPTIICGYGQP